MASLAKSRAIEEQQPCYLVYDSSVKSYYASSAPENGWEISEHVVKRFLPDGTCDEVDDVPPRVYPEPSEEAIRLSEELDAVLDEIDPNPVPFYLRFKTRGRNGNSV
jgi:hypothetical protein